MAQVKHKSKSKSRKRVKKHVVRGVAHIKATFNNTVVTITDTDGNTVAWATAGKMGFHGSRKGTSFAAQRAAQTAGQTAVQCGMQSLDVRIKGPGAGREASIRALESVGLRVTSIKDVTGIPHNGCRPKKRRRV